MSILCVVAQELVDYIIDFLYLEHETLLHCSTVCRAFQPSSQYHLFHQGVGLRSFSQLDDFVKLLDSPRSIIPHIRHLRILEDSELWFNDAMVQLSRLAAVEAIVVKGMDWTLLSANARDTFLARFKHLKGLELLDNSVGRLDDALRIACAFPSLENLSIRLLSISSIVMPRAGKWTLPRNLRSLSMSGPGSLRWIQWILSVQPILALNTIRIMNIRTEESEHLGQILQNIGSTIKELELGFYCAYDEVALCRGINLQCNTELRAVRIQRFIIDPWIGLSANVELVLLSQITSHHITDLALEFRLSTDGPSGWTTVLNSRVDWAGIDEILGRPPFLNLRRVELVIDIFESGKDSFIRDKLPACLARGILYTSFRPVQTD